MKDFDTLTGFNHPTRKNNEQIRKQKTLENRSKYTPKKYLTIRNFKNHDKCNLERVCHRNLNKDCNFYCKHFIK
jgi:hypothetical protein